MSARRGVIAIQTREERVIVNRRTRCAGLSSRQDGSADGLPKKKHKDAFAGEGPKARGPDAESLPIPANAAFRLCIRHRGISIHEHGFRWSADPSRGGGT